MATRRLRAFLVAGAALVAAATAFPAAAVATAPQIVCATPTGMASTAALAGLPAPRIIALSGSVPIVTMQAFAEFLIAMGYPEASLRDPRDGSLAKSSYTDSAELAGAVAWYYERDAMRPMLIGHSQGGMLVVRTLHELAGDFHEAIPVFDPVAGRALDRTSIRDPYTQAERPVVGVRVSFAAALATGALPRLLLGQWTMLPRLRKIPDTALEFTGFTVPWDPIAGNLATAEPYVATGSAEVRNVLLPATYTHIGLPATEHLAAQPATRAWIDAYTPDSPPPLPDAATADVRNLVHAADLWHSIRVHWCREGQRRLALRGPA
ncbi:MAG: hypothetical protein U1F58_03455 [Burkholderiales bacterium]